jgi:UDP-N-acetylglucosamine acyltransferase
MNSIHPTAILSGKVLLGDGNVVGPHAVILGPVSIGDDNWIGAGAIIGAPPEVRSFPHTPDSSGDDSGTGTVIGHRNVLREYVQVHRGWKAKTEIHDDTFIMNQSYVAHDSIVHDGVTMASGTRLAGHTIIGTLANLGLGTLVHQRRQIGAGAMVGMGSVVTRDVPPFAKAFGNPARIQGINEVVLYRLLARHAVVACLGEQYAEGKLDIAILEKVDGWSTIAEYFLPTEAASPSV